MRNALLAPEMASHGGAQAYMWRLFEVLEDDAAHLGAPRPALWSLNDSEAALRRWGCLPAEVPVHAGQGDKLSFSLGLLRGAGRGGFATPATQHAIDQNIDQAIDHAIVGLIGLAPLAWLLRASRRIGSYTIILHGIEAWGRLKWGDRQACQRADRIIATTQYTAQRFASANGLDPGRISVIPLCATDISGPFHTPYRGDHSHNPSGDLSFAPNGHLNHDSFSDPSNGPTDEPPRHQAPPRPDPDFHLTGDFKVLSVGRQSSLERYKGFDELLEATRLLCAQGVPLHLHLVGQGDDQTRLQALATQHGIAGQVTFHGSLAAPCLQAAYAQCDLFALPSGGEGFGIVFLEAMHHAKPCIGARAGGIPEVLVDGETGLLVDYGDVGGLAATLHQLWSDPALRERLGAAGRRRLHTHFSPSRFKDRHLTLLRR